MTTPPPAGWHHDPTGRHEQRYSDGAQWTEHVADGTTTGVDPYSAPIPPPAPPVPPAGAAPPAAAAPEAPGAPTPDPTMRLGGWPETADAQHSPTTETPVASAPAAGWPDYGQAPPTTAAGAWSSIDEPIAPDPTTTFPAPPVGQAAAAPGAFQSPPPYAGPPPASMATAPAPESSGGTRWGLIALIALLVAGAVGAGVFVLTNLSDDGDDGVADDPATAIPEFGEDARLDNLARACENGDFQSCDDLYYQSGFKSGYEEYGDTCGGRNTPQAEYCTSLY